eukprot:15358839-Heterocapsa_arctica.AAC.1
MPPGQEGDRQQALPCSAAACGGLRGIRPTTSSGPFANCCVAGFRRLSGSTSSMRLTSSSGSTWRASRRKAATCKRSVFPHS